MFLNQKAAMKMAEEMARKQKARKPRPGARDGDNESVSSNPSQSSRASSRISKAPSTTSTGSATRPGRKPGYKPTVTRRSVKQQQQEVKRSNSISSGITSSTSESSAASANGKTVKPVLNPFGSSQKEAYKFAEEFAKRRQERERRKQEEIDKFMSDGGGDSGPIEPVETSTKKGKSGLKLSVPIGASLLVKGFTRNPRGKEAPAPIPEMEHSDSAFDAEQSLEIAKDPAKDAAPKKGRRKLSASQAFPITKRERLEARVREDACNSVREAINDLDEMQDELDLMIQDATFRARARLETSNKVGKFLNHKTTPFAVAGTTNTVVFLV